METSKVGPTESHGKITLLFVFQGRKEKRAVRIGEVGVGLGMVLAEILVFELEYASIFLGLRGLLRL